MLKSYFKLALKVLSRKKFFTFISLFGISFTLMILMLVTAFLDNELGSHAPLTGNDRMVFIERAKGEFIEPDTTAIVDSIMVGGQMKYDTLYEYGEHSSATTRGNISFPFIDKNLRDLPGAERQAIFLEDVTFNEFRNNKKFAVNGMATNAEYWQVFDFEFIAGRPYGETDVRNGTLAAVLTDKSARFFFGTTQGVVGQDLEMNKRIYEVVGLVKMPDTNNDAIAADMFFPYTNLPPFALGEPDAVFGRFSTVILAESAGAKDLIIKEVNRIAADNSLDTQDRFNRLTLEPVTFFETYAHSLLRRETQAESKQYFLTALILLLSLFVLLPTLNLININVSRILERASEIGVRKSFGADTRTILFQFVFENVILTLIGGIIGFLLALGLIYLINTSDWLNGIQLNFNPSVAFWSFVICLFFGVISGFIPAYKTAKMQIVSALKSNAK